jgi:hypothetical protein
MKGPPRKFPREGPRSYLKSGINEAKVSGIQVFQKELSKNLKRVHS